MPKIRSPRVYIKCLGCGKMTPRIRVSHTYLKYCPVCEVLDRRMQKEDIPLGCRKYFWRYIRKFGLKCCLSGVSLEINDYTSAWYLNFSRVKPGDKRRVLPAAAVFCVMKQVLSHRLFRYYVCALDDHRRKHIKIKKRPIPNWSMAQAGDGLCPICGKPRVKGQKFCVRCLKLARRMKMLRFPPKTVKSVWDYLRTYGFVCYYTGMPLDLDNPKSPWHLEFDHWMPRDARKVVVTSDLVNKMKGDLTEDEFWYFIHQLAEFYRKGTAVKKRKLRFWKRPYRF